MVSETVQIGVCLNVCGIKGVCFGNKEDFMTSRDQRTCMRMTQEIVLVEKERVLLLFLSPCFLEIELDSKK